MMIKLSLDIPYQEPICFASFTYDNEKYNIFFHKGYGDKVDDKIGTGVNPEYRNKGFASLLASLWTWICMDNNFYEYVTNKKQRKPFLIYLLKLYGFEINDIMDYETSRNTIFICRDSLSKDKCLYFKDTNEAKNFNKSNISKHDNYRILSSLDGEDIEVLDKVILTTPYQLQDFTKAYTRSRKKLESHGII